MLAAKVKITKGKIALISLEIFFLLNKNNTKGRIPYKTVKINTTFIKKYP
jgi:hypothetical protein